VMRQSGLGANGFQVKYHAEQIKIALESNFSMKNTLIYRKKKYFQIKVSNFV
jgi:hypothetical protein